MAQFSSGLSGIDFTPSVDFLTAQHNALANAAMAQQTQFDASEHPSKLAILGNQATTGQLANQYTQAAQPSQLAMLSQSQQMMGDAGAMMRGAPPSPDSAAPVAPSASPVGSDGSLAAQPIPNTNGHDGHFTAIDSIKDPTAQVMGMKAGMLAGLPPAAVPYWISAVHNESGWNLNSPDNKNSNGTIDVGPGQLNSNTYPSMGLTEAQARDPQTNLIASAKYFAQKWQEAGGNPVKALTGYNAGNVNAQPSDYAAKALVRVADWHGDHADATTPPDPQGGPTSVGASGMAGVAPQSAQGDMVGRQQARRLLGQQMYYMSLPGGAGASSAAKIQSAIDNIAGPGGVIDPATGAVFRVPGADATRFASSQATEGGKVAPSALLAQLNAATKSQYDQTTHTGNATLDAQLARQTHQANSDVDLARTFAEPKIVGPGMTLTTPANATPGSVPAGLVIPTMASTAPPPPLPSNPPSVPVIAPVSPGPTTSPAAAPVAPPSSMGAPNPLATLGSAPAQTPPPPPPPLATSFTVPPMARNNTTTKSGNDTVMMNGLGQTIRTLPPDTRTPLQQQANADYKQVQPLAAQSLNAEQSIQKTLEARNAAAGLPTGAGFEARQKLATYLQTYFPDAAKGLIGADGAMLPNVAQSEEAKKLQAGQAFAQEKANGGSGGLGLSQIYLDTNPNLGMQPESIRNMSNLAVVSAMASKDYAQGKINHITQNTDDFNGGAPTYTNAASFDRNWFSKDNANTYMAAINAMNGKPYESWAKNLTNPEDKARALGVIARIDPNATVYGCGWQAFVGRKVCSSRCRQSIGCWRGCGRPVVLRLRLGQTATSQVIRRRLLPHPPDRPRNRR